MSASAPGSPAEVLVWEHQRMLGVLQAEQQRLGARIEEVSKTAREDLVVALEGRADGMDRLENDIRRMVAELKADTRDQVGEIKDGQRWITRLVLGAVVLAGLGLLFSGHVGKTAPMAPPGSTSQE